MSTTREHTAKRKRILPYWQDIYSLAMVAFCTYLLVAPFFLSLSPLEAFGWIALSSFVNFIVNLIDHNHIHVGTFGYRPLNVGFGLLLTALRGASERFTVVIHNMNHHRFEGTKEDWFWPGNAGDGPVIFQPLVYTVRTARRFKREGAELFARMKKQNGRIQLVENISLVLVSGTALVADWSTALLFVLIPWICGNYSIVYTNLLFHKDCDPSSKLTLSRNYLNPVEGAIFLYGGYHTMHHLKPRVHWSQLPAQHEIHVAPQLDPKYVRNSMVVDTFREYLNPFGWGQKAPQVSDVGVLGEA